MEGLVPQAKQLGVLSLPLPLLQLITESCPPTSQTAIPAYNSLRSGAGVASMAQETPDPTPDTMSSMSTSGQQLPNKTQTSHLGKADKDLLNEFIRTPPTNSPPQNFTRLHSLDVDGSAKVLPPAVNSLSTPDCHSLPQELQDYARDKGIELWAGSAGEGSDPLPSVHLHNTLQEFIEHLPKHLIPRDSLLGSVVTIDEHLESGTRQQLGVDVEWVLGVSGIIP
jgi:hypothetical protein